MGYVFLLLWCNSFPLAKINVPPGNVQCHHCPKVSFKSFWSSCTRTFSPSLWLELLKKCPSAPKYFIAWDKRQDITHLSSILSSILYSEANCKDHSWILQDTREFWKCLDVCVEHTQICHATHLSANKGQTGENMGNWMEFSFSSFEIGHACPTYKPRCTGCQLARFTAVPLPVNLIVCKNIASYLLIRFSLHLS